MEGNCDREEGNHRSAKAMMSTSRNYLQLPWTAMAIMLSLCLFPVSMVDNYPLKGPCHPGQFYNHSIYQCEPCPLGTFQGAVSHQNRNCTECRKPEDVMRENPPLMLLKPCTNASDTTFKCGPCFYPAGYTENQHSELPPCWPCNEFSVTRPECADRISTTVQSNVDPEAVDDDKVDVNGSALCNGSSLAQYNDVSTVRNNDTAPCNRSSPSQCDSGESHEEGSTSGCSITCIVLIAVFTAVGTAGIIIAVVCVFRCKRKSAAKKRDVRRGINDKGVRRGLIDRQKATDQDTCI